MITWLRRWWHDRHTDQLDPSFAAAVREAIHAGVIRIEPSDRALDRILARTRRRAH